MSAESIPQLVAAPSSTSSPPAVNGGVVATPDLLVQQTAGRANSWIDAKVKVGVARASEPGGDESTHFASIEDYSIFAGL